MKPIIENDRVCESFGMEEECDKERQRGGRKKKQL
jgi:hypothetical protein